MHRLIRAALLIAVVSLTGALLSGCSDKPSEEQCTSLVDHIIELEIKAAGTDKLSAEMKADLDKQRTQLKDYLRKQAVETCLESLPTAVVECGLEAKSLAAYAECEKQ